MANANEHVIEGQEKYWTMKQSFAWWSFMRGDIEPGELLRAAADIGYGGVDLVPKAHWPLVREQGLVISAIDGHASIEAGLNRREHHSRIERELTDKLKLAETWGIPNLICFSGSRGGRDDAAGAEITAEGLRRAARLAEDIGTTLVLELLNSKVDHPGYQADHTTWGVEVCRMVDSPRVKLLYDIYHMQIMEGDIIRTIRDWHPYFAHYHTAGNPGRHEIDDNQELNYRPIIQTIRETGYAGWLCHEFVPSGDAVTALRDAFNLCQPPV